MIRVEAAIVSAHAPDIVRVEFIPTVGVDIKQAREVIEAVLKVADERLHGNLVDARNLLFITNDARQVFAKQSPKALSGTAIMVGSAIQRSLGNLYLSVSRPTNPTKLFSDESSAVDYLRQQNQRAMSERIKARSQPPAARSFR